MAHQNAHSAQFTPLIILTIALYIHPPFCSKINNKPRVAIIKMWIILPPRP